MLPQTMVIYVEYNEIQNCHAFFVQHENVSHTISHTLLAFGLTVLRAGQSYCVLSRLAGYSIEYRRLKTPNMK